MGRERIAWIVGAVAGLVLILGSGAAVFVVERLRQPETVEQMAIGDCTDKRYEKATCAGKKAAYEIVGSARGPKDCRAVPGADRQLIRGYDRFCLMPKGIDPAASPNTAVKGDCLDNGEGRGARLRKCNDPSAVWQVVDRREDVAPGTAGCATRSVVLNWDEVGPEAKPDTTDDVVLCLAANDPKTAAASPTGPADTSQCRFLSDEEMTATLNASAGKGYSSSHVERSTECNYVVAAHEQILIWFRPDHTTEPGTADQPFTLDGLKAFYGPGEGNRLISVNVGGGEMTIVVWLKNTSDAYSKNVAIALFRALRSKIKE